MSDAIVSLQDFKEKKEQVQCQLCKNHFPATSLISHIEGCTDEFTDRMLKRAQQRQQTWDRMESAKLQALT
jgi:hypothetical protein